MNARIRNLIPKHTRTYFLKQKDLDIIACILSNSPRQVLGFKTTKDLFYEHSLNAPS